MCQFKDWPLISKYTREDAIKDGILSELLRWNDLPVMVTTSVRDDFRYVDLLNVWHQFLAWEDTEGRRPQKEDKIFTAVLNGKKIWVMQDIDCFTILFCPMASSVEAIAMRLLKFLAMGCANFVRNCS